MKKYKYFDEMTNIETNYEKNDEFTETSEVYIDQIQSCKNVKS